MKAIKMKKEDAILLVIDFQEKLMPIMKDQETLGQNVAKLINGCRILGLPILVTQQYSKGLGETVQVVKDALGYSFEPIEKITFSCCGEPAFIEALESTMKKTIIVSGIESHICVQQTVLDLLSSGYEVFIINDCIASRNNNDKKYAQRRMSDAGACGTTFEATLFELCVSAKAPEFKAISALVK
jgi:nicotinamidase-related amidase